MHCRSKLNFISVDINECVENSDNCQHTCTNTLGSYLCECYPGYMLDPVDQRNCNGKKEAMHIY